MEIDFSKPLAKYVASSVAAVLIVGAVLDTISNAISIVSPMVTYVGSAVALSVLPLLWVLARLRLLTFRKANGVQVGPFDLSLVAVVVATIAVLWLPRVLETKATTDSQLLSQRDAIEIQGAKVYEVFYPRPYASAPSLGFSKKISGVYFDVVYDVVEQRPDGFKLSVKSNGWAAIEWVAVGIPQKLGDTK